MQRDDEISAISARATTTTKTTLNSFSFPRFELRNKELAMPTNTKSLFARPSCERGHTHAKVLGTIMSDIKRSKSLGRTKGHVERVAISDVFATNADTDDDDTPLPPPADPYPTAKIKHKTLGANRKSSKNRDSEVDVSTSDDLFVNPAVRSASIPSMLSIPGLSTAAAERSPVLAPKSRYVQVGDLHSKVAR
jgi:hypothetical protein